MSKTIIFIHGMACGAWSWDGYKDFFEKKGYKCIVPDLRYHNSGPLAEPDPRLGTTGILDFADDLEKEIKSLKEIPILIGHSMGGLLAQTLAGRGLASAAVLLCPAPPRGIIGMRWSVIQVFLNIVTKWGWWKKPFRFSFDRIRRTALPSTPVDDLKKAFGKMVSESGQALFEISCYFLDSKRATEVNAENIKCPMLIISGKQDKIMPASVVRNIAKKYSAKADYLELDNHSHWIIGETGWQDVAQKINEWLNNCST
uniref:Hydrolase alpha/beta hydrolase fold family n=1 Tax=uncultured microorganism TaxID=358574 RepID=F8UGX8_9ZZZZ|nr:hydrolase alpha/beta hydrolase fold family [uncultured microorganism]